jgi:hypothetical protein
MTKQLAIAAMMLVACVGLSGVGEAAGETLPAGGSQIRSGDARIVALIARATEQSPTFRGMVETIEATDGIVYIERGVCRSGARACLIGVTKPGAMRFLWIRVDLRKIDRELMALMGHELQHAIEVLRNREVVSTGEMVLLYERKGMKDASGGFETVSAIEAGQSVALELAKR